MQAPQMSPYSGTMITTELIQKYLDENKQLILAILDNQNLGKLHECAAYQSKLQQNLMYLAAIADAQPQAPIPAAQMQPSMQAMPGSMMQANAQYMHPQQQQQQHQMAPPLQQQQQAQQMHYMQLQQAHVHQQQQQRSLGMHMSPHGEIDLSGGSSMGNLGYADYGAAAAAAAAHGHNNGANVDARNGATAGATVVAASDKQQTAGATAGGGGGTSDGNTVGVNGSDDAGTNFLKTSEED